MRRFELLLLVVIYLTNQPAEVACFYEISSISEKCATQHA